jgi:hypothetical protein
MSGPSLAPAFDSVVAAYQEGRRIGLATAALALSLVAYINLLGIEKSVLAGVLAFSALRGAGTGSQPLRRGRVALVIAALHVVFLVAVLSIFHDKFMQLVPLLQKLG